jgi:hypothetical protein
MKAALQKTAKQLKDAPGRYVFMTMSAPRFFIPQNN